MYKERFEEIDIAKGIGILLVVIGHSIPDANTGIQNIFWGGIFKWIYSFHMGLFMFMAGVLFYKKAISCTQIKNVKEEISRRALRLLVPYFTFSIIIYIAKTILSSWSRKPVGIKDIIYILLGKSPCGNMWFLWTLFIICVLVLFFPKKGKFPELLVMVTFIIYFFQNSRILEQWELAKICKMAIWFTLGMLSFKYKDILMNLYHRNVKRKTVIVITLLLSVQIVVLNIQKVVDKEFLNLILQFILILIGIILVLVISFLLKNTVIARRLRICGRQSMDIYVLSYLVTTPGIVMYSKTNGGGIPYNIWVIGLALSSICFSFLSAKYIRKYKILKLLVLGEKDDSKV